jgi:hypothetical protein
MLVQHSPTIRNVSPGSTATSRGDGRVAELRQDRALGLADLTGKSLKDLAELDDALIREMLAGLLPVGGSVSSRLWQNNRGDFPAD